MSNEVEISTSTPKAVFQAKIIRVGNSWYIRIPQHVIKNYGFRVRDQVKLILKKNDAEGELISYIQEQANGYLVLLPKKIVRAYGFKLKDEVKVILWLVKRME